LSRSEPALLGVERSLTGRRWLAAAADEALIGRLHSLHALPEMVCRVLAERGIGHVDVPDYLAPTLRALLPDPSSLVDMDRAAERLCDAVVEGERIAVFADYDVDGATSSALLRRFLAAVGCPAALYVPDRRREGYGPSTTALLRLREDGVALVVTVDCGTAAHEPIAAAAAAGLDVIVVDHHQAPAVPPPAVAVVNPNRPDDRSGLGHLAAVGVAFLVAVAVNRALRRRGWYAKRPEPDLRRWLDLVALGTVCDMVPLAGLNRAFVVQGLKIAATGGNPGLAAIAAVAGVRGPLLVDDLGFAIGPRINAGGRVGEADLGARLLASDEPAEAAGLAARLDAFNRQRQQIEAGVLERALQQTAAVVADPSQLIWVAGEDWHPGVVGIVASRLVERFHKPAVVVAVADGGAVASCRSIAGIDLGRAIREALAAGLLLKGGGHAMAGGFTVGRDRLAEIERFLDGAIAEQRAAASGGAPTLRITASLGLAGLGSDCAASLERLAPFGAGNPEPLFAVEAARLQWAVAAGQHLSCRLLDQRGGRMGGMLFRAAGTPLSKALTTLDGAAVHLAGRIRRRRDGTLFFAIEDAAMPV
jgi:single-stranded-DNA-specific exonuclease